MDAPLHVVMVTDFYWPLLGGVEQHVRTLSQELVRRGHRVTVATLQTPGTEPVDDDGGIEVVRVRSATQRIPALFDQARPWAPPIPDPAAARALRRLIRTARPDVVHGHDWLLRSALPLGRSGPPVVSSLHYYTLTCARKDLLRRGVPCSGPAPVKCLRCAADHYGMAKGTVTATANALGRRLETRAADRFIAVSRATATGNGFAPDDDRCVVIPNFLPPRPTNGAGGIDDESVETLVRELPGVAFFLYVGDFRATKGFEVLLDAYAGAATDRPLVVIGKRWPTSPTEFPPGVVVLEEWPNTAVRAAFARAYAAIVPSIWVEPFGIVAIEAMEGGAPVIASATGGLVDIVDDERTGLLVPPGSADDLRAAMERIDADPGTRDVWGAAAAEEAQRYTAERVVDDVVDVYRRVVGR